MSSTSKPVGTKINKVVDMETSMADESKGASQSQGIELSHIRHEPDEKAPADAIHKEQAPLPQEDEGNDGEAFKTAGDPNGDANKGELGQLGFSKTLNMERLKTADEEPKGKKIADLKLKAKIKKDANKLLWEFLAEQWWLLLIGLPFMFAGSAQEYLVPDFIGKTLNAMKDGDKDEMKRLIFWWVFTVIVGASCGLIRDIIFGITSQRIGTSLRQSFFKAIIYKDVSFFDDNRTGEILSRLQSDTEVVQEGLTSNVAMFFKSGAICIGITVIMFTYSWKLTVVAICLIMPTNILTRYYMKMMFKYSKAYQTGRAGASSVADETIGNIRTMKAFADEKGSVERYHKESLNIYNLGKTKAYYYGGFQFTNTVLYSWAMAGIMFYISFLFKNPERQTWQTAPLSIGQVLAYLLYMKTMTNHYREMAGNITNVSKVFGASQKIATLIVAPSHVNTDGTIKQEAKKGEDGQDILSTGESGADIKIDDIQFAYPSKADVQVLKGVSIDVKTNQIVAIVGTSGCGKSSIISLIERFYDPTQGTISYNGDDIKTLDNRWYHQKQIAIVSQEPVLFSGSIKANIMYGVDFGDLTKEQIEARFNKSCEQANIHTFVQDKELFPEGYASIVGERGVRLSGGQKQRIAIARALVREPRVLLLDEATSALDAESEHQVQQALDKLIEAGQQTIIVIAHRLSTIRNADQIVVMKYGEVIEKGTHDELIALQGNYHKLVERQLQVKEIEEALRRAAEEAEAAEGPTTINEL